MKKNKFQQLKEFIYILIIFWSVLSLFIMGLILIDFYLIGASSNGLTSAAITIWVSFTGALTIWLLKEGFKAFLDLSKINSKEDIETPKIDNTLPKEEVKIDNTLPNNMEEQ